METLPNPERKTFQWIKKVFHNKFFISGLIIVIGGAGYFTYQKTKASDTATRYLTSAVQKGTVILSVSGTGQVNVSNQVDIKPKASGQLTSVKVKNGDVIKAGTVIAQIETTDAQKAIRDASLNLQNALIPLEKLKEPTDEFTIAQAKIELQQAKNDLVTLQKPPTDYDLLSAQNAITQAQRDIEQAKDNSAKQDLETAQNLQKAYDDGYTAVSNAYLDIPQLIKDAYSVQWGPDDPIQKDHIASYDTILGKDSAFTVNMVRDYQTANDLFTKNFNTYKTLSRSSTQTEIYKLLDDTLTLAKAVSAALESTRNLLDAIYNQDYKKYFISSVIDTSRPLLQSDIATINKNITALQNARDTIANSNQNSPLEVKNAATAIKTAEEKLKEREADLAHLKEGPTEEDIQADQEKIKQKQNALDKLLVGADPLDIKSQQLTIAQRKNALSDAQKTLGDYAIIAPFDCIVSDVAVAKGDTVSSSTIIATVITQQVVAEVSLNEVDVAKIKVGQKVTMAFDAVENLSITGHVAEIDVLGTVTQGVVTYNVTIAFDTQDERIKPGMTVSAEIITNIKQDVLTIPNAALKTEGDIHYVEILDTAKSSNSSTQQQTSTTSATAAGVTSLTLPIQQIVEIGIANDTVTEITANLKEGDQVITKTTTPTTKTTTSTTTTGGGGLNILGGGGGGAGGIRRGN